MIETPGPSSFIHASGLEPSSVSGVAVSIVEEELLADRLFKETVFTCSW